MLTRKLVSPVIDRLPARDSFRNEFTGRSRSRNRRLGVRARC